MVHRFSPPPSARPILVLAGTFVALAIAAIVLSIAPGEEPAHAKSLAAERGERSLKARSYTAVHVSCRRGKKRALCRWSGTRRTKRCRGTLTVGRKRVRGRFVNVGSRPRCARIPAVTVKPPLKVGFNTYADPQNVKLQLRTGATVRRLNIEWSRVQPLPGVWEWTDYDRQHAAIVDGGATPLIMLYLAPCWARPQTACDALVGGPPDPGFDDEWAEFVRRATKRYGGSIGVEIWNEPNLISYWGPRPDPVRFATVLKAAYGAVKGVDPAMPVVSGGLLQSTAQGYGPYSVGDQTFLRDALAAGAGDAMDAIGFHAYPVVQRTPTQTSWDPVSMADALERIRDARDAVGGRQPIWLTELGVSTSTQHGFPDPVDGAQQADQIGAMLDIAEGSADVPVVIVHTLVDASTSLADDITNAVATTTGITASYNRVNGGFGVFDSRQRPKPSACVLSRRFGGTLGC